MNALDMIDRELERAAAPRTSNRKPIFLFLKEGHKALIRPLYNLSEALVLRKHSKWSADADQRVNAICAGEEMHDCHYCHQSVNDKKLNPAVAFYLPMYAHKVVDASGAAVTYKERDEQGNETEKPVSGIRLLELTSFGTIGAILKFFREFLRDPDNNGTITGCDFTITQSGSGQGKSFVCMPKVPKPLDPRIAKIIPTRDKIQARILEALPPMISAEEEQFDRKMDGKRSIDPAVAAVVQGVKNGQQQPVVPAEDEDEDEIPEF